jgi:lipooligosaccharide transport system permease protein
MTAAVTGSAPPPAAPGRVSFLASLLASYEHQALLYRRTWRGSIFGNFLTPVMFLLAMGVGLGGFVDRAGSAALGGVPYLAFLAPGLLASSVMQSSSFEATFPIMGGFRWIGRYHAMYATPLTPAAIALGQMGWIATRALLVSSIFFAVMVAFGTVSSPWGVVAIPVAALTGLSFAGPIAAYMATQRNTESFNAVWRFGIIPLFLFSGTFFPVSQMPDFIEPVAWLFPMWHGADLARALTLGTVGQAPLLHLVHLAVLVGVSSAGLVAVVVSFRRQLLTTSS